MKSAPVNLIEAADDAMVDAWRQRLRKHVDLSDIQDQHLLPLHELELTADRR